jgi:predicted nucleotidyltransferase
MTDISLDISGKIDEPTVQALAGVKEVADAFGVPFFIIGAKAKELLLKHVHGLDLRRSTKDMDFGVSLTSWRIFSALKTELIDRLGFAGTNQVQRIRFNDINIDLVPFGPIAGSERMILWPPDESRRMTTAGFEEAFEASPLVKIRACPELTVRVCSLAGLVILKLIAWHELYPERGRDAADVLEIMDRYEQAYGLDKLYSEEQALMVRERFDRRLAAIRLLGRDVARIVSPETGRLIRSILEEETGVESKQKLAIHMAREMADLDMELQDILAKLSKLKQGFIEAFA